MERVPPAVGAESEKCRWHRVSFLLLQDDPGETARQEEEEHACLPQRWLLSPNLPCASGPECAFPASPDLFCLTVCLH